MKILFMPIVNPVQMFIKVSVIVLRCGQGLVKKMEQVDVWHCRIVFER